MIIFKDALFGDELFTDASKPKLDEDGICFVFDTKQITVKEGDVDGALLGANASAEEAAEESETTTITGFDFAIANRLSEVEPPISNKKMFQAWAKGFFKKLLDKAKDDPDKTAAVKKAGPEFLKKFQGKVEDLSFFGAAAQEDNDDFLQGNIVVVEWNDDGVSGKAYCLRCGLIEEKV